MNNLIRRRVSQNRKRFVEGRYDLDLTYITDNIIAMGYPSDKAMQSIIRNHIAQVARFLNERHPSSFKIFNLCAESDYNFAHFQNMVEVIPFEDHNPPRFLQIAEFCVKADSWLKEKLKNVVIVHCKAGKGRTGTMISCYLIHSKQCQTPFEAMAEFEKKRTKDQKGVTIPSQRRYVEYYGLYLKNNVVYKDLEISIKSVSVCQETSFDSKYLSVQIHKRDQSKKIYDSKLVKNISDGNSNYFIIDISDSCKLTGDIKLLFLNKSKEIIFSVSFNTFCSFNHFHENEYALNEQSYQGKKRLDSQGNLVWTLTKELVDGGPKNKNLDSCFKLEFIIETDKTCYSSDGKSSNSNTKHVDLKSLVTENRLSQYDNIDSVLGCYSVEPPCLIVEGDENEKEDDKKTRKLKEIVEEEIIDRKASFFSLHHMLKRKQKTANIIKKTARSLYKSNSEPFLNSQFFQPELNRSRNSSTESLDI